MNKRERKQKQDSIRTLLIGALLVVLLCFVIELFCNYPVMKLSQEERGVRPMTVRSVTLDNFHVTDKGYELDTEAQSGTITWKIDRAYVDKFQYSIDSQGLFDATLSVTTYDIYGNETEKTMEDNSPILVPASIVNIGGDVTSITLTVSEAVMTGEEVPLIISEPVIMNRAYINVYRIAVVFLLGMMVVLLIAFRSLFWNKLEYGFALVALLVGFSMLLCFPSSKVGWDEEAHIRAAYRLSALVKTDAMPSEIYGHLEAAEIGWPLNPPTSYEETQLLDRVQDNIFLYDQDDIQFGGSTRGFATAGTIFQAGAILVARFLNLSWSGLYFLGRLVNLLTYVIAMFWVIRILPVGKKVTTFISLMPTSIFLAVCYTYDVVVYAFILLGLAIILKEWFREDRKVDWRYMVLAYLFFLWGAFSKQVYAPLILITWLIPGERFKNSWQKWILKLLSVAVVGVLLGSMLVLSLLGRNGSGDSRGGSGVNNGSQMQLVLAHPIAYVGLLIKEMLQTLYEFTIGGTVFRQMGHLPDAGFEHLIPLAAFSVLMVDQENTERFKLRDRIFMFLLFGGVAALVWSALYIQFTPVGATWIGGVQARYYRPFLPLLYMIFGNHLIRVKAFDRHVNGAVLGVSSLIMIGTVWQVLSLFRM